MAARIGFATSVELGLSCMEEIVVLGGSLDLVLTLRDDVAPRKSGRVSLDDFCARRGFPLKKMYNINDDEIVAAIRQAELDWLFVLESQIIGDAVLDAPRLGCLGMHPALLPEGRGRAVIPWAILKGLTRTGLTMFKLDAGVDTGPIVEQVVVPVAPDETATTLYAKMIQAHRTLVRMVWEDLKAGCVPLRQQDDRKATVWPGRKPEDGRIERAMSVVAVERLVRAVTHPYPGARWRDADGREYVIWSGHVEKPDETLPYGLAIELDDGTYVIDEYDFAG